MTYTRYLRGEKLYIPRVNFISSFHREKLAIAMPRRSYVFRRKFHENASNKELAEELCVTKSRIESIIIQGCRSLDLSLHYAGWSQ